MWCIFEMPFDDSLESKNWISVKCVNQMSSIVEKLTTKPQSNRINKHCKVVYISSERQVVFICLFVCFCLFVFEGVFCLFFVVVFFASFWFVFHEDNTHVHTPPTKRFWRVLTVADSTFTVWLFQHVAVSKPLNGNQLNKFCFKGHIPHC